MLDYISAKVDEFSIRAMILNMDLLLINQDLLENMRGAGKIKKDGQKSEKKHIKMWDNALSAIFRKIFIKINIKHDFMV